MVKVADGFIKDDEETKEPEEKPPAKRFKSSALPKADALQALLCVSSHFHNTMDETMINRKHQIDAYEAMSKVDKLIAAALIIRLDYERQFVGRTHFEFFSDHLAKIDFLEVYQGEDAISKATASYLASQGYRVVVPLNPRYATGSWSIIHLGTVYWDGSISPTDDEFVYHHRISVNPTGPLLPLPRSSMERSDGETDQQEVHGTIIEPHTNFEWSAYGGESGLIKTFRVLDAMAQVSAQVLENNPNGVAAHMPMYYIEQVPEGLRVCQTFLHPLSEDIIVSNVFTDDVYWEYLAFAITRMPSGAQRLGRFCSATNDLVVYNNLQ
jgi:hypothetical protein